MKTFVCKFGTFTFEVVPFGLMNAPVTYHKEMDKIFDGFSFVRFYLDYILIFSKTIEEHLEYIAQVLDWISLQT